MYSEHIEASTETLVGVIEGCRVNYTGAIEMVIFREGPRVKEVAPNNNPR